MQYNILGVGKLKSRAEITSAAEHNFRLRSQENINPGKTHLNKIYVNSLGVDEKKANSLQIKLTDYYESLAIKEKVGNVLLLEFVVTASPEFFQNKSPKFVENWAQHQVEFFKNEFGSQLKIAILHLDEKTPHLHFKVSTEHKSVKNYKNRYGSTAKETWSLNAKRYGPEYLFDLHTRHAKLNEKFGLKRGVEGSLRKHTSLKEFYSIVDKALSADYGKQIERSIESLQTGLLTGKVSIEEVREKFKPTLNKLLKQNKVLKEKFALDIKKWAEDLAKKEIELNEALKNARDRRDLYREAISEKKHDTALLAEQKKELADKQKEITRLKEKYEPATKTHQVRDKTMKPFIN
jgi:hypothetical protein